MLCSVAGLSTELSACSQRSQEEEEEQAGWCVGGVASLRSRLRVVLVWLARPDMPVASARHPAGPPCVVFLGPGRSNFVFPSAPRPPRMLAVWWGLGSASSAVGPARRVTGGAWSCCPGSGGRWPGGLGRGGIRRLQAPARADRCGGPVRCRRGPRVINCQVSWQQPQLVEAMMA
jgi:hypothetical protein